MPLRTATPRTIRNPNSEPSVKAPALEIATMTAPPTSASGSVRKANVAKRQLEKAACKRKKIPIAETKMMLQERFCAA